VVYWHLPRPDGQASPQDGSDSVMRTNPSSAAASVVVETTLSSVEVGDGFTKWKGALLTEGTVSGNAPVLTIREGVRLGSLQPRVR
jgi:hypothetical protein